jgi:hypothetical protein
MKFEGEKQKQKFVRLEQKKLQSKLNRPTPAKKATSSIKERSRSKESNIEKQRKKHREAKKERSRSKERNIEKQRKKDRKTKKEDQEAKKQVGLVVRLGLSWGLGQQKSEDKEQKQDQF